MSVCNFSISVDSKLTRNLLKHFADGSFALFWCNLNFSCEFNQLRSVIVVKCFSMNSSLFEFRIKISTRLVELCAKWYPNSFKQILLLLLANIFFLFYLLKARLEIQVKLSVDIFQIKSAPLLYIHIKILATISISMNRESPRCSGKELHELSF